MGDCVGGWDDAMHRLSGYAADEGGGGDDDAMHRIYDGKNADDAHAVA